jgi:fumarate hydratase class II
VPELETRIERDALGEIEVPADALWGAATQRAIHNFPISGERLPRAFLRALGQIKRAAAHANRELGVVDAERAAWIARAAEEVEGGALDAHFPVDVFQTGSGTSTNMNANEVIARRAGDLWGPDGAPIHPNDHVNASQSSNDVVPTALHVGAREAVHAELLPALATLARALRAKQRSFRGAVKLGRTHLMDATPVRVGDEFGAWAAQIEAAAARVRDAADGLAALAIGGTAVGNGLNCPAGFAERVCEQLSEWNGHPYGRAPDSFAAQGAQDAAVHLSGALRGAAVACFKVASDVRLLAAGPRGGIAELRLPSLQPGSSIMPGKVNPVLCEAVIQVAAQVIGNDAAVGAGGLSGQLELGAYLPLLARNLLESIRLLGNVSRVFADRCIDGLEVDEGRARAWAEQSTALVTALAPTIGYDRASELAKSAFESGRTIREVALAAGVLAEEELDRLLDLDGFV